MTSDSRATMAAWHAVNAQLSTAPPPPPPVSWWRRNRRWLGLAVVVDVLAGAAVVQWLHRPDDSPQHAVAVLAAALHDKDWAAAQRALCVPDQQEWSVDQAQAAVLAVGGIDAFRVSRVEKAADADLWPAHVPARLISGELVPVVGRPSAAHVTVVDEPTGWKVCFSVGGYGAEALGVDEPRHQAG